MPTPCTITKMSGEPDTETTGKMHLTIYYYEDANPGVEKSRTSDAKSYTSMDDAITQIETDYDLDFGNV